MENFHVEYKIAQLISKELIDELTPDESAIMHKWLDESEDNRKLYEVIKSGKNKKVRDNFVDNIQTAKAWKKINKQIVQSSRKVEMRIWLARAAVILIIGLCAGGIYYLSKPEIPKQVAEVKIQPGSSKAILVLENGEAIQLENEENDSIVETDGTLITNAKGQLAYSSDTKNNKKVIYNTVNVPRGGEYKLLLSDGTKVWLNSESQIRYPVHFSKNKREVWIRGEVYFDVEKDESCPFIVGVNNIEVEVLGTEFNIEAYDDKTNITTTLVEGKVKLTKVNKEVVILKDQQAVTLKGKDDFIVKNVDAKTYTLWKEGYFYCEAENLSSIMEKLSRWYDVNIFYMNKSVKEKRFSIEVKRYEDIDNVLDILSATNKVNFKINANNITVME